MPDNRGLLREVAWQEVFPWLLLLRTFRLAVDFRKLLLAALGIALMALGWWLVDGLFAAESAAATGWRQPAWPWNQGAVTPPRVSTDPVAPADSLLYLPWRESRRA